jgi:hypothetical protein
MSDNPFSVINHAIHIQIKNRLHNIMSFGDLYRHQAREKIFHIIDWRHHKLSMGIVKGHPYSYDELNLSKKK